MSHTPHASPFQTDSTGCTTPRPMRRGRKAGGEGCRGWGSQGSAFRGWQSGGAGAGGGPLSFTASQPELEMAGLPRSSRAPENEAPALGFFLWSCGHSRVSGRTRTGTGRRRHRVLVWGLSRSHHWAPEHPAVPGRNQGPVTGVRLTTLPQDGGWTEDTSGDPHC